MENQIAQTDNGRRIDGYRQIDHRGWVRSQAYTQEGPRGITEYFESIHVATRTDTTPVHTFGTYHEHYDSRCSWCYLGAGHSEAAHSTELAGRS